MQFETVLVARIPRLNCPEHGVKIIQVPWAAKNSRFTLMFEAFVIRVLQACETVQSGAGLLGWIGTVHSKSWSEPEMNYSRLSTLGSTTVPSGKRTTKYVRSTGSSTVRRNSQCGTGVVFSSWLSIVPTCSP